MSSTIVILSTVSSVYKDNFIVVIQTGSIRQQGAIDERGNSADCMR